jgi:glycerophosphoryl diester phosphodiesterase
MTNSTFTGSNALYPWGVMKEKVKVVPTPLLGPGWANKDIPTVREVLDKFLGKVVIFVEAKSNAAVPLLQNLLLQYPGAGKSVVWKNYYTANSFAWAKSHGFRTWAYVDVGTSAAAMDAVDANVDYWGVPAEATDSQFTTVVARGKKTIVWEVHRRSERDHLVSLGVQGMMCSQYSYVTHSATTPILTDAPVSWQVKSPGDIGAAKGDPLFALKWDTGAGGVYCPATSGNGNLLGSRSCMTDGATGYKITFDCMFPVLPTGTLHAGLWFGAVNDSKHQFGVANDDAAYRMLIRPVAGDMQLYTVAAAATSGVQINTTTTAAMTAGVWASFEIEVNATQVILRRTDGAGWTATAANTFIRGRYFGIHNGSLTDVTTIPRFRNIKTVTV